LNSKDVTMQTRRPFQAQQRLIATTVTLLVMSLMSPALGYAQQTMNAQALTPEGIALSAAELGPEWSIGEHHSATLPGGSVVYDVIYTAASGRGVELFTDVSASADLADAVISTLRYDLDTAGVTVSSVQSDGFGDGRAFKAQASDGTTILIGYLFRVRNLMVEVTYSGSASAGDIQTQALAVARKQEAKLFAAFAPPPAPPPTAVPPPALSATPQSASSPTATPLVIAPSAAPPAAPYCRPGDQPQLRFGFATLSAQLGGQMGNPTSCEYDDPLGSGDTLQTTDTGLAVYRVSSNTATFTTGSDHWALLGPGVVYWTGTSIDPPDSAEPFGS
jgi:hypothetical protein